MKAHFNDGRDWFFNERYGMFIHFGLYTTPGFHEQHQWRKRIPIAEYKKLISEFNPVKYNPEEWVDLAQSVGMKYITITTKHHDGFCLWDTKYTDYNVMKTPYGKDVIKLLADACKKKNFKLGLYYSCPDWSYKHSINYNGDHELPRPNPGDEPDIDKYLAYVKNQVKELCTNYGTIHEFFWDIPPRQRDPSINEMMRKLQPSMIINDRGYDKGDYDTPERTVPAGKKFSRPTEACQSVDRESWGFRFQPDFFSNKHLMYSIAKIMAMGGNYLLNVGPAPDGTITENYAGILRKIGAWYNKVSEALHADPASEILDTEDYLLTRKDNTLYLIFCKDPAAAGFVLYPVDIKPKKITLLNTGSAVLSEVEFVPSKCWSRKNYLHIMGLPVNELISEPMVLKMEFDVLDYDRFLKNRNPADLHNQIF